MTTARTASLLLLLAAAGCAGSRASAPAPASGARPAGLPADAAEALSARSQRLYSEAVQAQEDQRRLKVPTDWAVLERKWRAVLDAGEVAEARHNLGVALEAQGRVDEARAEYQKALAAKPGLRQAAVNLGVLLEKQGDLAGAQSIYAAVVRDFPEDARARERLAAMYRNAGQLDEAWRLAREALLRDPRSVGAYMVMARVSLQRGNLDVAQLILLRAQKLAPSEPELPFLAGEVLAKQGEVEAAAVQWRKALALDDGFLPARRALLDAAVKGRRWPVVAEHAQAMVRADPKSAPAWLALGVAKRHLDKPDEALAAYARAQEASGDALPEVHLARGVLFMRVKNECEPALEELRAYGRMVGPVAAADSPALKLQRECEQIVAENRRAQEAAKEMQREAERKAAEAAARKAAATAPAVAPAAAGAGAGAGKGEPAEPGTGAGGGAAPTSPPNPSR
ncbi:adventurous gliding motility TPR repeat lipoprotein GltE [Anaeromyxobacter sp. Red801]|uniref:adventurous gliding motility TPR repeat lipoprotein GltE n=1 Tax=Anaeromyxobacter sp. Red801 TaxID=3411632 RepID=UPI003B9DFC5F